ncbi:hypothetical protein D9M72_538060 [compost metagenome]
MGYLRSLLRKDHCRVDAQGGGLADVEKLVIQVLPSEAGVATTKTAAHSLLATFHRLNACQRRLALAADGSRHLVSRNRADLVGLADLAKGLLVVRERVEDWIELATKAVQLLAEGGNIPRTLRPTEGRPDIQGALNALGEALRVVGDLAKLGVQLSACAADPRNGACNAGAHALGGGLGADCSRHQLIEVRRRLRGGRRVDSKAE